MQALGVRLTLLSLLQEELSFPVEVGLHFFLSRHLLVHETHEQEPQLLHIVDEHSVRPFPFFVRVVATLHFHRSLTIVQVPTPALAYIVHRATRRFHDTFLVALFEPLLPILKERPNHLLVEFNDVRLDLLQPPVLVVQHYLARLPLVCVLRNVSSEVVILEQFQVLLFKLRWDPHVVRDILVYLHHQFLRLFRTHLRMRSHSHVFCQGIVTQLGSLIGLAFHDPELSGIVGGSFIEKSV